MIVATGNASGPLALAGADGPSTEAERTGRLARLDHKKAIAAAVNKTPAPTTARQVTWVDTVTGAPRRYMLPAGVPCSLTSSGLTEHPRLLFEDEGYAAAYNQVLSVLAASALVEQGTAKSAPIRLVALLLQEIDRQSCMISTLMRDLRVAVEAHTHDHQTTV